jgi:hypothetical protein
MRRLVIALLVLVGLLVAVDFGSAAIAESAVSRQMREQIGLADDPAVRINGFPFLTQALAGEYSSVDVAASRISVGELREVDVTAQLRDVTAPLSMLLGSGPKTLRVDEAEGTVRISAEDLQRLIPGVQDLRIESIDAEALQQAVEDGGEESLTRIDPDSAARLVGTSTLLGQELEVSVIAVLELVDGQAQIVPRDIRLGGDDAPALPGPAQRPLQQLFTVRVDPGSLPLQVTPTALRARDGALEISGTAQDLVLGAGSPVTSG